MTTILLDFQDSNPQEGNWNVATGATSTGEKVADLVDDTGASTGISLYVDTAYTGQLDYSTIPAGTTFGVPAEVWRGAWYNGATPAAFSLRGFSAAQTGTIQVAGSSSIAARDTTFSVSGGDSGLYDSSGDTTNPAEQITLDWTADGSGNLVVTSTRVSVFAYVSFAIVTWTAGSGVTGSGSLSAGTASVGGTAEREISASGTMSASAATVSGTAVRIITSPATLTASAAEVSGSAVRQITSAGTLQASPAETAATVNKGITITATLEAGPANVNMNLDYSSLFSLPLNGVVKAIMRGMSI